MATWNGSPAEESVSAVQEESGPLKVESEFPWIPHDEVVQIQEDNYKSGVENVDVTPFVVVHDHPVDSVNSVDSQSTLVSDDNRVKDHDEIEESYLRTIHTQDDAPDSHVANLHENLRNSKNSSDISSSFDRMSMASLTQRSPSLDYPCDDCQALDKEVARPESKTLWHEIPCKGMNVSRCHIKLWSEFKEKLEKSYPNNAALKSRTTLAMMKSLLHVDQSDPAATVEYKRFVELMKFFGPLLNNDGVMLDQLYKVATKSLITAKRGSRKTEKISWFAGKMSRTAAEERLNTQQDGTYLIRMSETQEASFVISVKDDGVIEHFEIPQDYRKAADSTPFDSKFSLNNTTYSNLVDAVKSLTSHPLKADNDEEVWCRHVCPGLPLNGFITGYKKTGGGH